MKTKLTLLALLFCFTLQAQDFEDDYDTEVKCSISYPHFHDINHSSCIQEGNPPGAPIDSRVFIFIGLAAGIGLGIYRLSRINTNERENNI